MKTILIVDDEPSIRRLVSATLSGDDRYRVVVAEDGVQAMEVAKLERPDLVFLDIRMPRADGYAVCRELKSDPTTQHAMVIMLSALVEDSDREKAKAAGADDYLTKPFSPTTLLSKVEAILNPTH